MTFVTDGKKINRSLIIVSLKKKNLFLSINTTAKKGANKIISSQIKHTIGKKIKTNVFTKIGLNLLSHRNKVEIKKRKIKISFLPRASSSAMGYNRNNGEKSAKNCVISSLNFLIYKNNNSK